MSLQDDFNRDFVQPYAEQWAFESPFLEEAIEERVPAVHRWYEAHTPFIEEQKAPAVKVTAAQFRLALMERVPKEVINLLDKSKTFKKMGGQLDKRYVYLGLPHRLSVVRNFDPDTGVVKGGGWNGRRVITIDHSTPNTHFEPYNPLKSTGTNADVIFITIHLKEYPTTAKSFTATELTEWISRIAHETTHAHNFLFRKTLPPTAKVADRIRDRIEEEVSTRQTEVDIISEIKSTPLGSSKLKDSIEPPDVQPNVLKVYATPYVVERSFPERAVCQTYLEGFVLEELTKDTIRQEKLSKEDIIEKDKEVDSKIPLVLKSLDDFLRKPSLVTSELRLSSEYSKLRAFGHVITAHWKRLSDQHPSGVDFRAKELVLESHARAFFGGVISYTPVPIPLRAGREVLRCASEIEQ